jgi:hypothetical protein
MATVPMTPVEPVRASNISNQTLPPPTVEAIIDRRVGAVFRRAVPPPGTRTQHVHDPTAPRADPKASRGQSSEH